MSALKEPINTKKVEGRRTVRYESLDELLAEAERLASRDVRTLGNWSQGQIYQHLGDALNMSIDGASLFAFPLRLVLSLFFKKKFLKSQIPAGFKAPEKFVPKETSVEDGLEALRRAIARQGETTERSMHPGFGKLSRDEWEQFHLRHAEMHMSFLAEADA